MRIDGMDASTLVISKQNDSGQAGREIKPQTSDTRADGINFVNISQLKEFERNELPISDKVVIEAIERANKAIMGANRKFEFSIHAATKAIMVKVIDSDTNQVIREIPPEKILDMVAKMWEMAGLIVDERR